MIRRLGDAGSALAARFVPNPFLFAILLTFVALAAAVVFTDSGPWGAVMGWKRGFWELLTFAMQMSLILVTGHALASTRPVGRAIGFLAGRPRSTGSAPLTVATAGHFLEEKIGIVGIERTLGSPANLAMIALLLVGAPLIL
ncbi:MAG: hypothetical protein GF346_10070, partial [Candidatus Eisenbacteria bacterium]|nr:hypothetical protein [Candidatus Latescibacterota bacterium]MBD3302780.1 hypothetical protein [Candidatus Eisenbacteria bacterium]